MNLSKLIPFLTSLGIAPKKGLSQNFLIDSNVVHKIVQMADVKPGDVVLEIGPGPGALTEVLLQKGASVIALEKDRVLAGALERLQTEDGRLKVFCCDAMEFPWDTLRYDKIVANLPYHITTPLLEKCFATCPVPVTCMIQKEVADRMSAMPGTTTFGSFTLFTQFHTKLTEKFLVSANSFYPKPSVDSTVIHLEPLETPHAENPQFFTVMRAAFRQRRKCLTTSLKPIFSPKVIQTALEKQNIRIDARPEMLSLDQWIQFTEHTLTITTTSSL
jgi:16S rRNA (adenine1518-N6/adenine1519-N6)-dimethyltransferase